MSFVYPDIYSKAVSAPGNAPGGVILAGDREIAATVQCCHCGMHFIYVKGSGKFRTTCIECNRWTCGGYYCVNMKVHMSWDKRRELHHKDPSKYPLDPHLWNK